MTDRDETAVLARLVKGDALNELFAVAHSQRNLRTTRLVDLLEAAEERLRRDANILIYARDVRRRAR